MKLARLQAPEGPPFWAVVHPELAKAQRIGAEFLHWAPLVTAGAEASALDLDKHHLPLERLRFLPPLEPTARVMVAGVNYSKHLREFDVAPPTQPFAFLKASRALTGAFEEIAYPARTSKLDHEIELVAVVGSRSLDRAKPFESVLGYTVGNDVSARDLQLEAPKALGMDLLAAKSQDGSTPVGPWIVTRNEFPAGPPQLNMVLRVNDEIRQQASTSQMTWNVGQLLQFIDANTSFGCGDLLFTGSPEGIGHSTGRYLLPGDLVESTIDGIGTMRNRVGARRAS